MASHPFLRSRTSKVRTLAALAALGWGWLWSVAPVADGVGHGRTAAGGVHMSTGEFPTPGEDNGHGESCLLCLAVAGPGTLVSGSPAVPAPHPGAASHTGFSSRERTLSPSFSHGTPPRGPPPTSI